MVGLSVRKHTRCVCPPHKRILHRARVCVRRRSVLGRVQLGKGHSDEAAASLVTALELEDSAVLDTLWFVVPWGV